MNETPTTPPERIAQITIRPDHEIGDVMLKIEGLSLDGIPSVLYFSRCQSVADAVQKLNNWMMGVIIV